MKDPLRDFVESRVSLLEHAFRVFRTSTDKNQRNSAKYCFKQAFFYAAVNYMAWRPFMSEAAIVEAKRLGVMNNFPDARWDDQPRFDPGRETFHFEHVFTGEMCWNAIEQLGGRIGADAVESVIRENYAVAWILKDEDGRLPRSIRGASLSDARAVYLKYKVNLVAHDDIVASAASL